MLFCDNETNVRRPQGQAEAPGFFKDAFHEYIVQGNTAAVNPRRSGTKAGGGKSVFDWWGVPSPARRRPLVPA